LKVPIQIIPVIDLKNGVVVHAKEGIRDSYEPLKSALCSTSDIFQLIKSFIAKFQVDTLYLADLNAITTQGNHNQLIDKVLQAFPDQLFWLDRGYIKFGDKFTRCRNYLPVIGSESYTDETISELETFGDDLILSLDFSKSQPLGATSLFSRPDYWPANLIIMTLDRVGSNRGPDFSKLIDFSHRYPHKNFIAAGGIRNCQDLFELQKIGVRQVLVANALHSEAISSDDFRRLKQYPG
jgi:phosphoribosylformimino-5-aminoimidazole carboxamide ribotide isomerase